MMRIREFCSDVPKHWEDMRSATGLEPSCRDAVQKIIDNVAGWSSVNICFFLNEALKYLEDNECYLEIGTWKGKTFLSAQCGNPDKLCIGVDTFEYAAGKEQMYSNLSKWAEKNTFFIEQDCWEMLKTFPPPMAVGHKIGMYFYDGNHHYESQVRALDDALPYLAENCGILVDDTNVPHVREATLGWLSGHPEFKLVFDFKYAKRDQPTWWNGIMFFARGV